jgi:hypothetical protein
LEIEDSSINRLTKGCTPGGSEEWIRKVALEFTPHQGMSFPTLEQAIEFYNIYALACGFSSRKYTQDWDRGRVNVIRKVMVCNKHGFKEDKKKVTAIVQGGSGDSGPPQKKPKVEKKPRKLKETRFLRVGCKARIQFSLKDNVYTVSGFHEGHNHMLSSMQNREFQKLSRHLSLYHKQTIVNKSKLNIRATQTFRMMNVASDGYSNIGACLAEFKNFRRDGHKVLHW